jgi:hypothetical protein
MHAAVHAVKNGLDPHGLFGHSPAQEGDLSMELSEATVRELRAQRQRLLDEIRHAQRQVESISALLGDTEASDRRGGLENVDAATGLRALILEVVGGTAQPLMPRKVTEIIEQLGFINKGKTALNVKVGNEMWRLAKEGLLRRSKRGYSAARDST